MTRKVAIICPSYDGKVSCNFSISIAEVFRIAHQVHPDIELMLNFWMYEALVQKARNNLFADAVAADADDVVFIDGDQSFEPTAFFALLNHPVDVVGIPVRMKTEEERYNIRPEDPSLHKFGEHGLMEVENIGTGFLRLSRNAVKALWDSSQEYRDGDSVRRMICDLQIVDGGLISEDIQICTKLRAHGLKIYVDPLFTCKHFGTKCYEGSYWNYCVKHLGDDSKGAV